MSNIKSMDEFKKKRTPTPQEVGFIMITLFEGGEMGISMTGLEIDETRHMLNTAIHYTFELDDDLDYEHE